MTPEDKIFWIKVIFAFLAAGLCLLLPLSATWAGFFLGILVYMASYCVSQLIVEEEIPVEERILEKIGKILKSEVPSEIKNIVFKSSKSGRLSKDHVELLKRKLTELGVDQKRSEKIIAIMKSVEEKISEEKRGSPLTTGILTYFTLWLTIWFLIFTLMHFPP
ncbi:MAG: hypothetical protein ACTSXJ_07250 [Candidatus Baldrarchaeia archaeon]